MNIRSFVLPQGIPSDGCFGRAHSRKAAANPQDESIHHGLDCDPVMPQMTPKELVTWVQEFSHGHPFLDLGELLKSPTIFSWD